MAGSDSLHVANGSSLSAGGSHVRVCHVQGVTGAALALSVAVTVQGTVTVTSSYAGPWTRTRSHITESTQLSFQVSASDKA